jgi:uncharacterized protein YndB with AHSA1/START domain
MLRELPATVPPPPALAGTPEGGQLLRWSLARFIAYTWRAEESCVHLLEWDDGTRPVHEATPAGVALWVRWAAQPTVAAWLTANSHGATTFVHDRETGKWYTADAPAARALVRPYEPAAL